MIAVIMETVTSIKNLRNVIFLPMRYLFLLIVLALFLNACSKEEILNDLSNANPKIIIEPGAEEFASYYQKHDDLHFHGVILLKYNSQTLLINDLRADFFSDYYDDLSSTNSDKGIYAGKVYVNDKPFYVLEEEGIVSYSYTQNYYELDEAHMSEVGNFPGNTIEFKVEGSGILPPMQETFYLPMPLKVLNEQGEPFGYNPSAINRDNGCTLRWTTDYYDIVVVISISSNDFFESNMDYTSFLIVAKDDGEYYIPPSILKAIKAKEIGISIFRIRMKFIEKNGIIYKIICLMDDSWAV